VRPCSVLHNTFYGPDQNETRNTYMQLRSDGAIDDNY